MNALIKASTLAYDSGATDCYNPSDNTLVVNSDNRSILGQLAEAFSALNFLVSFDGKTEIQVQL